MPFGNWTVKFRVLQGRRIFLKIRGQIVHRTEPLNLMSKETILYLKQRTFLKLGILQTSPNDQFFSQTCRSWQQLELYKKKMESEDKKGLVDENIYYLPPHPLKRHINKHIDPWNKIEGLLIKKHLSLWAVCFC